MLNALRTMAFPALINTAPKTSHITTRPTHSLNASIARDSPNKALTDGLPKPAVGIL
jgi:hypothetical protein